MFFCEVSLSDLLDDITVEIPIEVVCRVRQVAVDSYGVLPFGIVPVLVHSSVGALIFQFTNIMALVTLDTESEIF